MAKTTSDYDEIDPKAITLYVKSHKVTLKNGRLVHIHHEKCKKPCKVTKTIVQYLIAEAFVTSKSIVLAETYDEI